MVSSRLSLAIVVAAAGYGTRLDASLPKQYVSLLGIPMIQRTLGVVGACRRVDAMLVVVNPEDVDFCRTEIHLEELDEKILQVVGGGEERAFSVRNGLTALAERGPWDLIGVHDGARPLVSCREIEEAVEALEADDTLDGVVTGIPSVDTIKIVDESGVITSTLDRRWLWRAQTPQVFRWNALLDAYSAFDDEELRHFTDDAAVVEARGGRVVVVRGSSENFKITDRADLRYAEHILAERRG